MTDDPEKIKVITMDKKGSFPSSFAANTNKSLALDNSAKTTAYSRQDGTSGSQISKVQPKTPTRYRGNQPSNTGGFSRNESYNRSKPSPQKAKYYGDRRPKSKCSPSPPESVAQKETEPEGATSHPSGGKKQNIKDQDLDLWGFQYAPLQSHLHGHFHRRSRPLSGGSSRSNYGAGPIRPKYSKDYLLANCQFFVRIGEDYRAYLGDPNLLVRWDLIEQVRIRVDGEMPKCPICLDSPVAAKITKCGHIYCWPCFLHYLSLSDNDVRTCPICYNPVSKNDLKSVSFMPQIGVEVGTKIEMRLMVRMKDANIAFPLDKTDGWEDKFCKILQVAPTAVIQNVLTFEKFELEAMFDADPFAPEACFIQQALNYLDERRIALLNVDINFCSNLTLPANGLISPECYIRFPDISVDGPPAIGSADTCGKKTRNDSVSSNSSGGYDDPTLVQMQAPNTSGPGHAYFYQMSDGRNVFLHPMNMAMLWRELGTDVEKWPQVLTFEVIDIESRSATEENRKRLKFCRHLPLNAPFELVEVNLDEFGISPEVKADFASQLHQRQQRRRNRAKEEKLLERKQRELEAQEFGKLRHMPQLSSTQEFPAFGTSIAEQEFALAVIQEEIAAAASASGAIGISEPECKAEETFASVFQGSSSFAQMAGKAPMKKSPTYPISGGSVWGKGPVAGIAQNTILSRHSDSENEGDDYTPVPNYRASVSDAIERALAGLDLTGASSPGNESESAASPGSGNKKKKSKKGKVLFATGMGPFN